MGKILIKRPDQICFNFPSTSWQVYKKNAVALVKALHSAVPELEAEFNPVKPRKKSFECTLIKDNEEIVLWSGIEKGPPRKLKFPESYEGIIKNLKDSLGIE